MSVEFTENPILYIERAGKVIEIALKPDHFSIDPSFIDRELCGLGNLILFYGQLETELLAEVERKEAQFKKWEADMDSFVRARAKSAGEKITEAGVQAAILSSPERVTVLQSITRSRASHNLAKWACKALSGKKDCLIALAYRDKELLKSDRFSS